MRRDNATAFWGLLAVILLLLVAAFIDRAAHAGMLGSVGQLMQPGQLQSNPVLSHRIVTEAGLIITTQSGDPLRTETDTP